MNRPYKVFCKKCNKFRYSDKNINSLCSLCKAKRDRKKRIKDKASIQFKKQVYLRDGFTCRMSGEYLGDDPKRMRCFKINKRKLTPKLENYITVSPSWVSKLARLNQKEMATLLYSHHAYQSKQ